MPHTAAAPEKDLYSSRTRDWSAVCTIASDRGRWVQSPTSRFSRDLATAAAVFANLEDFVQGLPQVLLCLGAKVPQCAEEKLTREGSHQAREADPFSGSLLSEARPSRTNVADAPSECELNLAKGSMDFRFASQALILVNSCS